MTRPDPDAPLNPVSLEQQMVEALNSISQSIRPVSKAYDDWQTSELAFKREYAMAFREAEGSIEQRKQEAIEKTMPAAEEAKDAEVIYKRMLDLQRAYRDKLSAYQTLAKSVNAAYGAAGTVGHG